MGRSIAMYRVMIVEDDVTISNEIASHLRGKSTACAVGYSAAFL